MQLPVPRASGAKTLIRFERAPLVKERQKSLSHDKKTCFARLKLVPSLKPTEQYFGFKVGKLSDRLWEDAHEIDQFWQYFWP